MRVLVGARTHAAVPSLAAALRRLGAQPEGVQAERRGGRHRALGARARPALGSDPRVAYVERDRDLRVAVDPYDTVD